MSDSVENPDDEHDKEERAKQYAQSPPSLGALIASQRYIASCSFSICSAMIHR